MRKERALLIIAWIAFAGMLFSGYLSWGELVEKTCTSAKLGMGECTSVGGIPACVYGFVMYLCVWIIAFLGLKNYKDKS